MKIEIGDLVKHADGDIGIVLGKMRRKYHTDEGGGYWETDTLYEIHWMNDGLLKMCSYQDTEIAEVVNEVR